MKLSIKFGVLSVVVMMFAFSSILFGADAIKSGVKPHEVQKLPDTIKINLNDIHFNKLTASSEEIHTRWKEANHRVPGANKDVDELRRVVASLDNKMEECKNKSFTKADMAAAGCTDNMSVAKCSNRLYKACIREEVKKADKVRHNLLMDITNIHLNAAKIDKLLKEMSQELSQAQAVE